MFVCPTCHANGLSVLFEQIFTTGRRVPGGGYLGSLR